MSIIVHTEIERYCLSYGIILYYNIIILLHVSIQFFWIKKFHPKLFFVVAVKITMFNKICQDQATNLIRLCLIRYLSYFAICKSHVDRMSPLYDSYTV